MRYVKKTKVIKKSKSLSLFDQFVNNVQSDVNNSIEKIISSSGKYTGYRTADRNIFIFSEDGNLWFWGQENNQSKKLLQ